MGLLRLVHDLDRAGVAHIGKQRAHAEVGLADGRLHILDRGLVLRLDQRAMVASGSTSPFAPAAFLLWMLRSSLLLADLLTTHLPPSHCSASCTTPGPCPRAGHHGGHTVDGAALWSTPDRLKLGWPRCREHAVLVAHHHRINARHLGQVQAGFSMVGE